MGTSERLFRRMASHSPRNNIKGIFFSEFHPKEGPKIKFQVPENFFEKEQFDILSIYIIPKREVFEKVLTVNAMGYKIVGYPISMDESKYQRNAFIWNLCFVFDAQAITVQYEPTITKLARFLVDMETDRELLSKKRQCVQIPALLQKVMNDINVSQSCTLTIDHINRVHLKVGYLGHDPPAVADHDVPVLLVDRSSFRFQNWDITCQELFPYMDGFNHVAKIAAEADVDRGVVKSCVQNLMYYGVVKLITIFQYSAMYAVTPKIRKLYEEPRLQQQCLTYVAKTESIPPSLHDVIRLYSVMHVGLTLKELCFRYSKYLMQVDERKLIQFGQVHQLIRPVRKFPVFIGDQPPDTLLQHLCDGAHDLDAICCRTQLSHKELSDYIQRDQSLLVIWK